MAGVTPTMRIVIITPAKRGSRHGNRNTAERWARHLRALGHRVDVKVEWQPEAKRFDIMIALHARRSHTAIKAWKTAHPERPLVLVLTGTDVYRDIHTDAKARESLELADRLVVLQPKALDELEAKQRAKAGVIFQSVKPYQRREPPRSYCLVTVIGHLRDEKDPFCAARALAHLRDGAAGNAARNTPIRVVHLGGAMSREAATEARRRMRAEPRYRWLGELGHARTMYWLSRSHMMVISSRMEGGAHVVSEAISAGVPVIASHIPGNVGLLGDDYPAYYPAGDERALAMLMERARTEPRFLARLANQVKARRRQVDPQAERRTLGKLMGEFA